MKRRIVSLVLVCAMSLTLGACGTETANTDNNTAETATENNEAVDGSTGSELDKYTAEDYIYKALDYVELGQFEGLEVTVDNLLANEAEGLNDYILSNISKKYVEDEQATEIAENSIVNVDYVGSKDGVPFSGGSAENQTIDVAGNCLAGSTSGYIPGFTSGLVGHKVGDEVACDITFPDNYGNAELAGQPVVFTFKINYIAKAVTVDMITDNNVSDFFADYTSVNQMKEALSASYHELLENQQLSLVRNAVMSSISENTTVNGVPAAILAARLEVYADSIAQMYGAESMQALCESSGVDIAEFYNSASETLTESLNQELIYEAIADTLDIQVDEADFENYVAKMMTSYGYTADDKEAFFEGYAVGEVSGEDYIRTIYRCDKAIDYCVDKAIVSYN